MQLETDTEIRLNIEERLYSKIPYPLVRELGGMEEVQKLEIIDLQGLSEKRYAEGVGAGTEYVDFVLPKDFPRDQSVVLALSGDRPVIALNLIYRRTKERGTVCIFMRHSPEPEPEARRMGIRRFFSSPEVPMERPYEP